MSDPIAYTLGDVALQLGCALWQVQKVFQRKMVPPPARVGIYRVVRPSELPTIARALREAGYLPEAEAKAATA
jgi:hypothetical protein